MVNILNNGSTDVLNNLYIILLFIITCSGIYVSLNIVELFVLKKQLYFCTLFFKRIYLLIYFILWL